MESFRGTNRGLGDFRPETYQRRTGLSSGKTAAENGKIAVALVGELRPHLVILDLSMPIMNGLDAAREISRTTLGMPMIMFTMHRSAGLRKDAERVGIKHVFCKEKGFGDNVFEAMREMLSTRAA